MRLTPSLYFLLPNVSGWIRITGTLPYASLAGKHLKPTWIRRQSGQERTQTEHYNLERVRVSGEPFYGHQSVKVRCSPQGLPAVYQLS